MKTRVISMILLASLSVGTAVSCGQNGSASDTSAGTDASDILTADTAEPGKKYDFGGNDFNVIGGNGAMINFPYAEENGDVINDVLVARDRYIEENYNIKIKYNITESEEACKTLTNSVLAGDNEYDMLAATAIDAGKIARKNVLYDILEMSDLTTDAPYWSRLVSEKCRLNGKLYFLSGDILPVIYTMPSCIFMNCDVAGKYGIGKDEVFKVVEDGEWTIDKLIGYTKDTSTDLNGDGVIKVADDFVGYASLEGSLAAGVLAVGSGIRLCTENDDGMITVDLMNDRVLGLIGKAKVLFADYKANTDSDSLHQALRENRFIFSQHYTSSAFTRYRDVEADYSILPIPKYDDAQDSYYSMLNPWMRAFASFPMYVDAEKAAVISEAMARYSYENVRPVVYEDGFKLKGARDSDSAKMLDLIFDTAYLDNNAVYDFGSSMTILSKAVFLGGDFASAYTSAEPRIEADIAKLYE